MQLQQPKKEGLASKASQKAERAFYAQPLRGASRHHEHTLTSSCKKLEIPKQVSIPSVTETYTIEWKSLTRGPLLPE